MNDTNFISRINTMVASLEEGLESTEFDATLSGVLFSSLEDDADASSSMAIASENFDGALTVALENLGSHADEVAYDADQIAIGTAVAILAADPRAALEATIEMPVSTNSLHHIVAGATDGLTSRQHALENFDERDTSGLTSRSIAYNMEAVKPSDFVKTMFPFLVYNPASAGIKVEVERMYRQDDIQRSLNGDVADYNRVMLTHAAVDSSILKDDSTRIVPARNANNTAKFVDTAIVPDWTNINEGVPVPTNYIKFDQKVDLIALSQTDTLLSKNVMNQTDQLDVANSVDKVAYQVGADIIEFNVLPIASSAFSSAHPGSGTVYSLLMSTSSLTLDANSTARADTAFTEAALTTIATNNWTVQLELSLSGTVDIDRGEQIVHSNIFKVAKVYDSSGLELALTDAAVAPTVALIEGATKLGYVPYGHRSNTNRRQRGRTLGSTTHSEEYYVPMRSPLSTIRQVGSNKENKDVALLISATHIEMANNAVETLEETASTLRDFTTNSNVTMDRPDYLGIGRFYVNPRFIERNLDLPLQINSLTSHDRLSDISAVLTLQMRDVAARLYLESGFGEAQNILNPGNTAKPKFVIATDPYTAGFLNESHGEALLGQQFDHVVVVNGNKDMRGKIYMVLGDQTITDSINPLGTGNTLYAPELLSNLVIDRDGATTKEVTVMQHYRMVMNANVMGLLHVSGLDDVLGSLSISTTTAGGVNPNSDPYLNLPFGGSGTSTSVYW